MEYNSALSEGYKTPAYDLRFKYFKYINCITYLKTFKLIYNRLYYLNHE